MKQNSNKIITFLHNFWQKLWGENIPDFDYDSASDDFYEKIEQQKKHKRRKESLKAKRILICFSLIIIIYLLGCLSVFGYKHLVKNNVFFACLGKDVCIYKGAKSNYKIFYRPVYTKISDNYILIKHFPWMYEAKPELEFYDIKKKQFTKVKKIRNLYKIDIPGYKEETQSLILNILKNNLNEIIILDYLQPISKFITKNNSFQPTNVNYINSKEYVYLSPYQDKVLLMSNFNKFEFKNKYGTTYEYDGIGFKDLTKKENLYLLNLNTLTLEPFSDFDVMPKRIPISKDIINLEDGTIIVPIRYKNKEREFVSFEEKEIVRKNFYKKFDNDFIWDHVEIYDPTTKNFKAEFNTDVLKENLFNFKLSNGNILFINQKDSYIFDINTHSFIKADENTQKRCQTFINNVNDLLKKHLDLKLEEASTKRIKYIKLNEKKYLLSCDDWSNSYKKNNLCNKTIIADFDETKAKIGPNFIYNHINQTPIPLNDKEILFIGGTGNAVNKKMFQNTQILRIKEK